MPRFFSIRARTSRRTSASSRQQDVLQQFNDRDFDAKHRGHAGEFAADESAAQDKHRRGQPLDVEEGAALDDALVFGQETGHGGGRAGGDDDLPGADARAVADFEGVAVNEARPSR